MIGAGHLMRCLALAEGLRARGAEAVFVTRTLHLRYLAAIERRGFRYVPIPAALALAEDAQAVAGLDADGDVAGVVVDRYGLPADYFTRLRTLRPAWKLAYVDDLGERFDSADLVVNQNITADAADYGQADETGLVVLAGSGYALLRSEFRRQPREAFTVRADVSRILLTLGGSDPHDHTPRLLAALDRLDPRIEIHVVAGPGCGHPGVIAQFAVARPRIKIHVDVEDMYGLMRTMDLSVNGSGSTLWELCYVGLPNVAYVLADNQAAVAARTHALGCSFSLGPIEAFDPARLLEAVHRLIAAPAERRRMSERGSEVIDGLGVDRVAEAFLTPRAVGVPA
jgi:UDP-2,4-diacetamido-2,4,6-trideoxy-beta-L-altropyranose hydrolase